LIDGDCDLTTKNVENVKKKNISFIGQMVYFSLTYIHVDICRKSVTRDVITNSTTYCPGEQELSTVKSCFHRSNK
jgi:hypothetical protein